MADTKVTALTENTTPQLTDVMYIVDDPSGSALSQKVTLTNVKTTILSGMVVRDELFDSTLGTTGTFTVSGISGAYDHLEFILLSRCDANDFYWVAMEINDDTTDGNYLVVKDYYGSDAAGSVTTGRTEFGYTAAANSPANHFAATHGFIYNYADSAMHKEIASHTHVRRSATTNVENIDGSWASTAAITKLEFFPTGHSFVAGSRLQVYGIKGV